ncbi:MAG: NAD(+)/NADH kinase [Dehalococcoidia bacterium]|nr:MAG: NAD(+)/NADH kinase [Dehalococcoidia bacterium]
MKNIGIFYHPLVEATKSKAKQLQDFLASRGITAWLCSAWESEAARSQLDDTDLVLSVGGDGTILRSAQAVVPRTIPIIGINLGKLGFMTELSADEASDKLPALLSGEGWIDERAMLLAELSAGGQKTSTYHALNDVVVARGAIARLVRVAASLNGKHITDYKADGVIVATATGSTGYSLAAGGPILYPHSKDFLLVPIMPHLSSDYALVLPAETSVQLGVTATQPATLSIDGYINMPLPDEAVITVKQSPHRTRFLRVHPEDTFYRSLEQKLKGKR